MDKKVIITGYGVVAKELCQFLFTHGENIKRKYGFGLQLTGIIGSSGMLYKEEGIPLERLLTYGLGSKALNQFAIDTGMELIEPIISGDVLVECTPTNMEHGEPGLSYICEAINAGMDVVAVSKGALVHAFSEINEMAMEKGVRLKFSGATAAALPTMDIGEYSLAGCTIKSIQGILNGTSNYILTSMEEYHLSIPEALQLAQKKGIAEKDASLDIKGFDAACKILLLTNGLFGTNLSIKDISIEGIEHITSESIKEARKRNARVKLIAEAVLINRQIHVEVKPCEIEQSHPLYMVNGTKKGIVFNTEEMGAICVTGGASNPRGAAAAALKDIINLYRM